MTTPMAMPTLRTVAGIINSVETLEGEGFLVRRPFPKSSFTDFDPFLLLDELGPIDFAPGTAKGAPDHPHRGFETVSYILEGRWQHKDSQGHTGTLEAGSVQWMTAGSGVVHSEMPEPEFARTGGRVHGIQLWVNLPQRDKMTPPRYQDIAAEKIPTVTTPDGLGQVKIIAGTALGTKAAIETHTPMLYLHLTLQPSGTITQPIPSHYNAFAYILDGNGTFGAGERASDGQMVLFAQDGDTVTIANSVDATTSLHVLLLAGVPLNEPIVRYGPFVMNTTEEIAQAFADYRQGKMGAIPA